MDEMNVNALWSVFVDWSIFAWPWWAVVKLLASHATEEELRAAIAFAQSPPGQAIIAREVEMDEELANIAHTFSKDTGASVRKSFCASQSEACARVFARLAEKPAGRP